MRSPYSTLAAVYLVRHRTVAWEAAERDLGRVVAEVLQASGQRRLTPGEANEEGRIQRELANLEAQLKVLRAPVQGDTLPEAAARLRNVRNRLLGAEAEWSRLQQEITQAHPVSEGQAYPLERVQAALADDEALVGWLDVRLREERYASWGYVIRNRGPVRWSWTGTSGDTTSSASPFPLVDSYRRALARPDSVPEREVSRIGAEIFASHVQPLLPELNDVRNLVVVPSGAMTSVPVEVLADRSGVDLGSRFTVSHIPSATVHTWLRESRGLPAVQSATSGVGHVSSGNARGLGKGIAGRVLLVGDAPLDAAHESELETKEPSSHWGLAELPEYANAEALRSAMAGDAAALARLPRLPGARDEILALSSLAPRATVLLGRDASEERLRTMVASGELGTYGFLHFATHALMSPERPENSCLVLSQVNLSDAFEAAMQGAPIVDGRITVAEILRDWQLEADLVTLSACATGLGRQIRGEGTVGFAHAFLQAGARSLVVSLWPVEDQASALLMERFYQNLWGHPSESGSGGDRAAGSKAAALQEARQWFRTYVDQTGARPYSHPFYWSAFVLIGDAS